MIVRGGLGVSGQFGLFREVFAERNPMVQSMGNQCIKILQLLTLISLSVFWTCCGSYHAMPGATDNVSAHKLGLEFIIIKPGEYVPGTASTRFFAALERIGLVEQSGASASAVAGTIRVSESFEISIESVPVVSYVEFLNSQPASSYLFVCEQKYPNIVLSGGEYIAVAGREYDAVNCATYEGAVEYCKWLTKTNRHAYRLPTETEWIIANEQCEFKIEHDIANPDLEVGNWTSDYYSKTLSSIVGEPDSAGPDEAERKTADGRSTRVVRYPNLATYNKRGWAAEGRTFCAGMGFRLVRIHSEAMPPEE